MFQRRQTIHASAGTVLGRVKSSDTADHTANTLGNKTFKSIAYNPGGPQRRIVVTKTTTTQSRASVGRATGGSAPQRTFSR